MSGRWYRSRAFFEDPYPVYHRLRNRSPLFWDPSWNTWLVTGYTQVAALLKEPRLSSNLFEGFLERLPDGLRADCDTIGKTAARWILYLDPPQHTRLRALVSRSFSPAVVRQMEGNVAASVERLLCGLERRSGAVDLVREFTQPLPAQVLALILDLDLQDVPDCMAWSRTVGRLIGSLQQTGADVLAAEQTVHAMNGYFRCLLERRRQQPGDDLISAMAGARVEGQRFSDDEIVAMCSQIFLAGHDTTAGLLANGLLALLRHPEALERWRGDPTLEESAVEELLRYDSPSQVACRKVSESFEFEGNRLSRGQFVNLFVAAANRDPTRFADPDELRLGRADNRHLAFGHGRHFCLGAFLARTEGRLALTGIIRRFPRMSLAEKNPPREPNMVLRELQRLPVLLET